METPEQDTAQAEAELGRKDPMDMPMDELKELIDSDGLEAVAPLEEAEPEEEPSQEAAVEEDQEKSADALETNDEQESESTFDPEDVLLRLEESEKRTKHFESLASRQANEKGQWMSKAQELEQRLDGLSRQQQSSDLDDPEPYRETSQANTSTKVASQDALLMQIGIEREAASFRARHPDAFTEDGGIAPDVAKVLQEAQAEATAIMESGDPVEASRRTNHLLESAYSKADIERTVTKRANKERRTADQAQGLKDKKRTAAISASGGESAAPKRKSIDPMTMPIDDLKKLIDGLNQ